MKITFLGAARTVTGSCHLVEVNGQRVLLDCGLRQGKRKESFEANRQFAFDPRSIDAVVLSHAHIDHCGNLPRLVAGGFRGPIWATKATRGLCEWMLRDSAHIQERDVVHVNKRRRERGQRPFEPLYRAADAEKALSQMRGQPYDRRFEAARGIEVTFRDAGHILGSASCHLRVQDAGQEREIVFTGDVGRVARPIIRAPLPPRRAEILICESTYGNRLHPPEADVRERLAEVVQETHSRGGRVLIPAFSVGRTQHLVYHLHNLFEAGRLPSMPIFVDSPLAANATDVYRDHPECYDEETLAFLKRDDDPFGFHRLTFIRDVEASKALNTLNVPMVLISASGMCEAGRVLHHLKRTAPDPRSTILVAGFMAQHTLGRRIVEGQSPIKIFGAEYELEARVESLRGLSGHADRDELLQYLDHLEEPPARTFLVHGEEEPAEAFAEALRERGYPSVDVPNPGQSYDV